MANTAFAEAFVKAGIDTDSARLAVVASNILARTGLSPYKALAQFTEIVQTDVGLLRAALAEYLTQRAADMRGDGLIGRGHMLDAQKRHHGRASADQSVGSDEGHWRVASARAVVPSSLPHKADREGQHSVADQAISKVPSRSAPVHDGRGQDPSGFQGIDASPVVMPPQDPKPWRPKVIERPIGNIEARLRAAQDVAKTVMDTYKVRGGIAIGDLGWSEAKVLARTNEREARVLRYITDHVANAEPGALIRDVVKLDVVQNAIKHAMEAENVLV